MLVIQNECLSFLKHWFFNTTEKSHKSLYLIFILFFSKWYIYIKDFMASHDKYGTAFLIPPFFTAIIRFDMMNNIFFNIL